MAREHQWEEGDDESSYEYLGPSKTQLKREAQALLDIGKKLLELKDAELARIPMTDELRKEVMQGRGIKAFAARKRHLKFLGRLLREQDSEAVVAAVTEIEAARNGETVQFHRMEKWRDRLMEEGDGAMQEWINTYPDSDWRKLRDVLRQARKEHDQGKPPTAFKQLFRLIRETMESVPTGE